MTSHKVGDTKFVEFPGRIRSEVELLCAVELIRQRDELAELLQECHNELDDTRHLYVSNDGSGATQPLTLPAWVGPAIRSTLYEKIEVIKTQLTDLYGIPQ